MQFVATQVMELWPALAESYSKVVSKPMDLGTIKANLQRGACESPSLVFT